MLNLITNRQMRLADEHAIRSLPIRSIDLMEQASTAFFEKFREEVSTNEKITICCGTGNNGGDGLAIARMMHESGFAKLDVVIVTVFRQESEDFKINKERLDVLPVPLRLITKATELPGDLGIVIDAVLGSGFRGELDTVLIEIFRQINQNAKAVFSVDCPSGLDVDAPTKQNYEGIRAYKTISFQRPKLCFTFPDSVHYTQSAVFVPIGLDEDFTQSIPSEYFWVEEQDIIDKLKVRQAFSHKGTYGHLLIIAGVPKTMGAALLCTRSSLFSGAGLVTACVPQVYFSTLNTYQPEVMTMDSAEFDHAALDKFDAIAIGPGIGRGEEVRRRVSKVLESQIPTVFDADALNSIASENWLNRVSKNSILTPHVKEFDRLFGTATSWADRLEKARHHAKALQSIIVLKNQYTFVCAPDGKVYVNSTGNPSMAQGGMGDVLTGCIAACLAQGYSSLDAALIGCYIHGKSGDILSESYHVTPASMVAAQMPKVWKKLIEQKKL